MPLGFKGQSIWPTRVAWPRRAEGAAVLPALAAGRTMRPYAGRSRFIISPLTLSLDQLLLLITAALLCFGLVMVQSADSRVHAIVNSWMSQAFNNKNAIHAGIALLVLAAIWRMDYRILLGPRLLLSPSLWLVGLTVCFLIAVLVTPLGKEINGARRWLALGPIGFQPSELAKLSLVLFVSAYAVHMADRMRSLVRGFLPLILVFGMVAGLVVKEDFGTTVLIAGVIMVMFLMAGCRFWHVGLLALCGGGIAYKLLMGSPFRRARLFAFLDPEKYADTVGYHPMQSLLTIASGEFWGRGLGNGIQKMGYLPEDNTDFIFAVVCEELGFPGALMVIGLFLAFTLIGWRIASRCTNLYGKMVAFGITAIIGLQAAFNVAVVTVSAPTKGIALPLISSGGTGWIMNAAAIGLLMSIERINRKEAEAAHTRPAPAQGFPVEMKAEPQASNS